METVGDRIRERRLALGLCQRALAGDGVSDAHISRIESNTRQPSIKVLRKLAPRLKVSVHWLETGEEDPAEQLARLVLRHHEQPLPRQALVLARAILRQRA
jgi:transcriptional regulator with XRE-family HTH domain